MPTYSNSLISGVYVNPTTLTDGIDAKKFGIVPNSGVNIRDKLITALVEARNSGKPVVLEPGEYLYSGGIIQGSLGTGYFGGGIVCLSGRAKLVCDNPDYTQILIDFYCPENDRKTGLIFQGLDFYNLTRPDSGLSNDSTEAGHFLRITGFDNVTINDNTFSHNYGGGVLIRSVNGASVTNNIFSDCWKDNVHVTGSSEDVILAYNKSYGAGDDAFAIVGVAAGVPTQSIGQPTNIRLLYNRAYGVRRARGFAIVGAKDVFLQGNYVNGTLPSWIPQQVSSTGEVYNTGCSLIVATENHGGGAYTYGNENITVMGHEAENISPGRWSSTATGGTPGTVVSALSTVLISNAVEKSKNINIQLNVKNCYGKVVQVSGATYSTDGLYLDITAKDNSGNNVVIGGQTYTQTIGSSAIDLQNVNNMEVVLRGDDLSSNMISINSACKGKFKFTGSVGKVSQISYNTNLISCDSTQLESADISLDFREVPGAQTLIGSIGNIVRLNGGTYTRDIKITGVQSSAWNNSGPFLGLDSRSGATPSAGVGEMSLRFINVGTRRQFLHYTGGTISGNTIKYKSIGLGQVVSIAGSTVVLRGNLADQYPVGTTVYWANSMGQFRAKEDKTFTNGQSLTLTTHASTTPVVGADGNTTVTFTAAPPTDLAQGMWLFRLSTESTDTGKAWPIHTFEPGQVLVQTFSANPPTPTLYTAQR